MFDLVMEKSAEAVHCHVTAGSQEPSQVSAEAAVQTAETSSEQFNYDWSKVR